MKSQYYSSLNAKMRRYLNNQKIKEINDELHNINLKEVLNKDNDMLNTAAAKLERETTRKRLEDEFKSLNPTPEQKILEKAEKAVKHELAKNAVKERMAAIRAQKELEKPQPSNNYRDVYRTEVLPKISSGSRLMLHPKYIRDGKTLYTGKTLELPLQALPLPQKSRKYKIAPYRAEKVSSGPYDDVMNRSEPFPILKLKKNKLYRAEKVSSGPYKRTIESYASILKKSPKYASTSVGSDTPLIDLRMYNRGGNRKGSKNKPKKKIKIGGGIINELY